MLDRLREGFQLLSQFSAHLVHDFRTPINNLMAPSPVALAQPCSNEDHQTPLASNVTEYGRLDRVCESMLFLGRAARAHVR